MLDSWPWLQPRISCILAPRQRACALRRVRAQAILAVRHHCAVAAPWWAQEPDSAHQVSIAALLHLSYSTVSGFGTSSLTHLLLGFCAMKAIKTTCPPPIHARCLQNAPLTKRLSGSLTMLTEFSSAISNCQLTAQRKKPEPNCSRQLKSRTLHSTRVASLV